MPATPVFTNYNTSQLVVAGNAFYQFGTYTDSGSGSTILQGTVLGRVFSSGAIKPLVSSATDGSQMPIGIAAETYVLAASASTTVNYVVSGEINSTMVIFSNGTDTLATTVMTEGVGGTIGDMIIARTQLLIQNTLDVSRYDNPAM